MAKVLIFSHYHEAWWRPDAKGYTKDIEFAGLYDADSKTVKWGSGSERDEVVPAADVLHLLDDTLRLLDERRAKARAMVDAIRAGEVERGDE